MDATFVQVLQALIPFGTPGLIAMIWYLNQKDFKAIMGQYEKDMAEQREMYRNNVLLVKDYSRVTQDLHSLVVMNSQVIQKITDAIQTNQFCPLMRVELNKKPGA